MTVVDPCQGLFLLPSPVISDYRWPVGNYLEVAILSFSIFERLSRPETLHFNIKFFVTGADYCD